MRNLLGVFDSMHSELVSKVAPKTYVTGLSKMIAHVERLDIPIVPKTEFTGRGEQPFSGAIPVG